MIFRKETDRGKTRGEERRNKDDWEKGKIEK